MKGAGLLVSPMIHIFCDRHPPISPKSAGGQGGGGDIHGKCDPFSLRYLCKCPKRAPGLPPFTPYSIICNDRFGVPTHLDASLFFALVTDTKNYVQKYLFWQWYCPTKKKKKKKKSFCRSFLVAQEVKYPALSLQQSRSLLWCRFNPCPGNFDTPQGQPQK